MGAQKNNQTQIFRDFRLLDGSAASGVGPFVGASGVAVGVTDMRAAKHTRLTVTGKVVNVDATNDYGSAKLFDLPDTNIILLATEVNLEITKGGTTNGIVAATDIVVGLGTTATASTTLSTATEKNIINAQSYTATDASPAFQVHSEADQATLAYPRFIADGASNAVYFNIGAAGITAADTVTLDGTIDIYWIDTGNVTS